MRTTGIGTQEGGPKFLSWIARAISLVFISRGRNAPPTCGPLLLVVIDGITTRIRVIEHFPFTVGRRSDRDLIIADPLVSEKHALFVRENNEIYLVDQASDNGTYINGERVVRSKVMCNDRIEFGLRDAFCVIVNPTRAWFPQPGSDDPLPTNAVEVIRVGASYAQILGVTQARIDYIDMRGRRQSIDLEECARNWMRWHDDHIQEFILLPSSSKADSDTWNARCVGERGALDHPPWVQFMNERNSRFEFGNYEALYVELLGPLMQKGWHTFDTD